MDNFEGDISHYSFDLSKDNFSFPEEIDILIHVAAAVPSSTQNDEDFFQINFEGSKRLIEKIRFSDDAKILNISTSSVYDDPLADILDETSKKTSQNAYGLSKLLFERYIDNKCKNDNIKLLSCRIPVLLVKDVKNNFISNWLMNIRAGRPITLYNSRSLLNACVCGNTIFDFFIKYIRNSGNENLTCNLSSKDPISILDSAHFIMDILDTRVEIVEKETNRKSQFVSYDLAFKNGFRPNSVKESLESYVAV